MDSRTRTAIVVGMILLSAAVGLALLILARSAAAPPESAPTPAPTRTSPAADTPSPAPPPSPTAGPLLYTIQDGDTLAGIAELYGIPLEELISANSLINPDLIHAGQVVVIPGVAPPTPQEIPSPTAPLPTEAPAAAPPTLTPTGPAVIEIAGVLGTGSVQAETVRVRNRGGVASMEGWTLSDAAGNRFTFPRLVLFPGGEVAIHSGSGLSTPTHLYWGRAEPAWDSGELITLRDRDGAAVDTYIVP